MQSVDNGVFAETIIVMAHKLGLKVIAEGVETVEQRDWLKAMGASTHEAFSFSGAVPSSALLRFSKPA